MTITYYFFDEPFEYEIDSLRDFIEDELSLEEQLDIYLDEIYDKSAEERDMIYQDFGLKSRSEVSDYIWMNGGDWLPEIINDLADEYVFNNYESEIKDYFEEDAQEEYEGSLETKAMYDEAERYYWSSR